MGVCVHVSVCMYVRAPICMCVSVHACPCAYMHVRKHVVVYVYVNYIKMNHYRNNLLHDSETAANTLS